MRRHPAEIAALVLGPATIYVVSRVFSAAAIAEWRIMTRVGWSALGIVAGLGGVSFVGFLLRRSTWAILLGSWAILTGTAFVLESVVYSDIVTPVRGVTVLSLVSLALASALAVLAKDQSSRVVD